MLGPDNPSRAVPGLAARVKAACRRMACLVRHSANSTDYSRKASQCSPSPCRGSPHGNLAQRRRSLACLPSRLGQCNRLDHIVSS